MVVHHTVWETTPEKLAQRKHTQSMQHTHSKKKQMHSGSCIRQVISSRTKPSCGPVSSYPNMFKTDGPMKPISSHHPAHVDEASPLYCDFTGRFLTSPSPRDRPSLCSLTTPGPLHPKPSMYMLLKVRTDRGRPRTYVRRNVINIRQTQVGRLAASGTV